jgi:zinc transporter 1/2/3
MPGLIAMMSVFVVIGIEMFFATRGAGHSHSYELSNGQEEAGRKPGHKEGNGHVQRPTALKRYRTGSFGSVSQRSDTVMSPARPGATRMDSSFSTQSAEASKHAHHHPVATITKDEAGSSHTDDESDLDLDELGSEDDPLTPTKRPRAPFSHRNKHNEADIEPSPSTPQDEQKQILQVFLLEAGILFHSIFIGMALSVSTGPSFLVLLVAISFHQTFEGLALGSRIASIQSFPPSSAKPWLMALAYGTTTPAGQAIGLLVHGLYDPAGQAGLLMVGCTNAVSSGLLLFAGLVELLAEDFLSDGSYEDLTGRRRLEACAAVVGGSLLMALVGAWA